MKPRYRLIRRGIRSGAFYCVDSHTGKRTSLGKIDADGAKTNPSRQEPGLRQPTLNLQIATAYLAGSDNGVNTRTWHHAIETVDVTLLVFPRSPALDAASASHGAAKRSRFWAKSPMRNSPKDFPVPFIS
jgi:hypothetical protein